MSLDIRTGVDTAFWLAVLGIAISLWLGFRFIRSGRKLLYFRKRRELMVQGWRLVFIALGLSIAAFVLSRYAEPVAYRFFPPSPTITLTPTITQTPTITLTPTITETPTITPTPLYTNTPELPQSIKTQFTSLITPNPEAVFSPLQFSKKIEDFLPVDPSTEFPNPVGQLFGAFTYNNMLAGSQWTAVWYRISDGVVICLETKPWDGSTGGYEFVECNPSSDQWLPGEYEVQLYVGEIFNVSSRFSITGEPIKPSVTSTLTRTATATRTSTITPTQTFTNTPRPSSTPLPTATDTATPTPSLTPTMTKTPSPTPTASNTRTLQNTATRWPTPTQ